MGLVSNGGACLYLSYYAVLGTWNNWGSAIQFIGWSSIIATFLITLGLFVFGMLGTDEKLEKLYNPIGTKSRQFLKKSYRQVKE